MKVKVFIESRASDYHAQGVFEDGKLTVIKGSKVRLQYASNFKIARAVNLYREDPKCVNEEGIVLRDCTFSSPSTAAQFITGVITNGYQKWRVKDKMSLSDYLGREK